MLNTQATATQTREREKAYDIVWKKAIIFLFDLTFRPQETLFQKKMTLAFYF